MYVLRLQIKVFIFHVFLQIVSAVLSVCVASHQGRAQMGVVGDGRAVPNAATLPQAFVTHLNELAVEAGVRLYVLLSSYVVDPSLFFFSKECYNLF